MGTFYFQRVQQNPVSRLGLVPLHGHHQIGGSALLLLLWDVEYIFHRSHLLADTLCRLLLGQVLGSPSSHRFSPSPQIYVHASARFHGGRLVIWLHSASERWHFNVTTAGRSILRLFNFFIEGKKLLLCRFMLIRVACLMKNTFLMWLHSAAESQRCRMITAGWSTAHRFTERKAEYPPTHSRSHSCGLF